MSAFDCSSVTIPIFLTFCVFFSGYDYGYPFIDKDVVDVQENVLDFYLYEFLPDLEKQTMAFIGCVQPIGAIMPIAELQCRYAMQVFKVNEHIPCDTYMCMVTVHKNVKLYNETIKTSYILHSNFKEKMPTKVIF